MGVIESWMLFDVMGNLVAENDAVNNKLITISRE
jgi:hypothetical protein